MTSLRVNTSGGKKEHNYIWHVCTYMNAHMYMQGMFTTYQTFFSPQKWMKHGRCLSCMSFVLPTESTSCPSGYMTEVNAHWIFICQEMTEWLVLRTCIKCCQKLDNTQSEILPDFFQWAWHEQRSEIIASVMAENQWGTDDNSIGFWYS